MRLLLILYSLTNVEQRAIPFVVSGQIKNYSLGNRFATELKIPQGKMLSNIVESGKKLKEYIYIKHTQLLLIVQISLCQFFQARASFAQPP